MKWKKWGSIERKVLVKGEIIRLKLIPPNNKSKDGYIYGRCTGFGFGCDRTLIGRAIYVENEAWNYEECKNKISQDKVRWNRDLNRIEVIIKENKK
jgi:hypothetical protein